MKVKSIFLNLVAKIKSLVIKIQQITSPYTDFLKNGKNGGYLLCALFSAQFFYGSLLSFAKCIIPSIFLFILGLILIFLCAELISLILKLILKLKTRSFIYFAASFYIIFRCLLSYYGDYNPTAFCLLIAFILSLSADILGRTAWSFLKTKKFKQVFGYITGGISLFILLAFAFFYRFDIFGQNLIEDYLAISKIDTSISKPGFTEYLQNGPLNVLSIEYNPEESTDLNKQKIVTPTVNLSSFAERKSGVEGFVMNHYFDYDLYKAPVAGKIWYPQGKTNCPAMFIVHGNHSFSAPSYLGYDYLGEYLASNGYVVISVDENCVNCLYDENDARAILLLENIKVILRENENSESPIYKLIDSDKITIAGHSRGGEMVPTAYLFNEMEKYPDNGNIRFDYHFNISSIISIAPTVDQYNPAGHSVQLSDVSYLLIHGANDQDVTTVMGEKQYHNITFTDENNHFKSSVYILGANHGQFNNIWGRYDNGGSFKYLLNTANFLTPDDQQIIAKAYIRAFLDSTLLNINTYADIFENNAPYLQYLPATVYQTNYQDGHFNSICSFDKDAFITRGNDDSTLVYCSNVDNWYTKLNSMSWNVDSENYVLQCSWSENALNPSLNVEFNPLDFTDGKLSFRIADLRNDFYSDLEQIHYSVELKDSNGNSVYTDSPVLVYPTLAVQLSKMDVFLKKYEYKHQMQTVFIESEAFSAQNSVLDSDSTSDSSFDFSNVCSIKITFDSSAYGKVMIDDIGFVKN